MQKNLGDIIADISRAGSTGILSVSVKNDPALCKIFFRAGVIYHMTHGSCRDMECVVKLPEYDCEAGFFMPGARVDMPGQELPPTEEIIARIKESGKMVQWEDRPGARKDAGVPSGSASRTPEGMVDVGMLMKMEQTLVNIVGPIAKMLLENSCAECKIQKNTPISRVDFNRLVENIASRLPEEQKKAFRKNFS